MVAHSRVICNCAELKPKLKDLSEIHETRGMVLDLRNKEEGYDMSCIRKDK